MEQLYEHLYMYFIHFIANVVLYPYQKVVYFEFILLSVLK